MDVFPTGSNTQTEYNSLTECNFRVNIVGRNVKVYKKIKQRKSVIDSMMGSKKIPRSQMTIKNTNYNRLVLEIDDVKQIFLSDDVVQKDNGNHVLVNSKDNEYFSIGDDIFSFNALDEIKNLESPTIAGGELKLPYAIGTTYTYFLNLNKSRDRILYIPNNFLKEIGFLSKNGKTFNWNNSYNFEPNIYVWGLDKSLHKKTMLVRMYVNRY